MSTCKNLIKQIEQLAAAHPNKAIKNVKLTIGELARVDVDELESLFPLASKGSCAENANLLIERESITVKCRQCGETSPVSIAQMDCPLCGNENTQLIAGVDMLLKELEFE